MLLDIEERVDKLETLLGHFIVHTDTALTRLERGLEDFKNEMREFKDEMKDFKDEMKDFKDEMVEFKNDSKESDRKRDEEIKKANHQAGELSRKFGTLVEDMVIPSLPAIIEEKFNLEIEESSFRKKKKHPITKLTKEYDFIVISGIYLFLNSTVSKLVPKDIDEFVNEIEEFRGYCPEYKEKKIIGVLATLYPEDSVLKYAEKTGFLVLGLGDWLMELKNSAEFRPKEW